MPAIVRGCTLAHKCANMGCRAHSSRSLMRALSAAMPCPGRQFIARICSAYNTINFMVHENYIKRSPPFTIVFIIFSRFAVYGSVVRVCAVRFHPFARSPLPNGGPHKGAPWKWVGLCVLSGGQLVDRENYWYADSMIVFDICTNRERLAKSQLLLICKLQFCSPRF